MSGRAPSAIAMRRIQVSSPMFANSAAAASCNSEVELTPSIAFLQSELNDWLLHPPEGCALVQYEPLLTWIITMTGPESAPGMPQLYVGEHFRYDCT